MIKEKSKKIAFLLCVMVAVTTACAQNKIYDENINAMQQIDQAVAQAAQSGKYVFCQVGGNWCPWCLRFADFVQSDTAVNQAMHDNFIYIHINYSKNNKNPEAMKRLANPARFGFPVFVILNEKGEVIHIQNSAYLEEGNGYDEKKVVDFLLHWTPKAVKELK